MPPRKTKKERNVAIAVANQKYSLQRRDAEGAFRKVATFDDVVTKENVLGTYGPGYYILRAMKPRASTVWKGRLGEDESVRLQAIEKKTKHLTYSVVGLAVGEVVGFGVSAWQFLKLLARVARLEVVMQALKPDLTCGTCGSALDFFLQQFCSQCGSSITWPEKYLPSKSTTANCLQCDFPLQAHQRFCPGCGQQRPIQLVDKFQPAKEWTGTSSGWKRVSN